MPTFEHLKTWQEPTGTSDPNKSRLTINDPAYWGSSGGGTSVTTMRSGLSRSSSRADSGDYSSTQKWTPSGDMPTVEAGKFTAPVFDDKQVSAYAQRFAAPNIRKLRNQVQAALSTPQDNPNVGKMTTRAALAGYGEGLESVTAGSYRQALDKYNQEYSRSYNEMMTNFQAQENVRGANFQAAMQGWLKGGETTASRTSSSASTGTTPMYDKEGRTIGTQDTTGKTAQYDKEGRQTGWA